MCVCACLPAGCGALPIPPEEERIEKACIDFWSTVHFGSGYLLGQELGEDSFFPTLLVLVEYEVAEPYFWVGWSENRLNQRCDIAIGALGWLVQDLLEEE
ncbi:MAG: hypothetical protein KJ749_14375 [Planctomycetes bacterium]|nr:hypothetical protein [Planctomycetota bacterium]